VVTPLIRSPWRNDATGDQVAAALIADGAGAERAQPAGWPAQLTDQQDNAIRL
jgi:hypothetical protein